LKFGGDFGFCPRGGGVWEESARSSFWIFWRAGYSTTRVKTGIINSIENKNNIKVIAFDFGGVIYNYSHNVLMKDVAKELKQPVIAVTNAWKTKINEYELGQVTENEFWNAFLSKLKINHNKKTLHRVVIHHFYPIVESLKILKSLKGKVILCLISNQTTWLDDLEKKYKFKIFFDIIIISDKVALRKPSKEIFNLFIEKAKVKSNKIIFVDDFLKYKEPTESVGINFIHFKNSRELKIKLKKYGVQIK